MMILFKCEYCWTRGLGDVNWVKGWHEGSNGEGAGVGWGVQNGVKRVFCGQLVTEHQLILVEDSLNVLIKQF